MTPQERDAFLREPRTAVLATTMPGGRPHAVPVWYLWDGATFRIVTGRGSRKHRNVERTGRAALCVDQRDGVFRYVTAEGPVTVEPRVTRDQRLALWTHYRGRDVAEATVGQGEPEGMVLLVLTPEHWLS